MTAEQEEQKLRKEVLRNDQQVREKAVEERRASTFLAMALADSELPGRFGKVAQQHVVGVSAGPIYPRLPEDAMGAIPWPEDCSSLGFSVEDMPPVGEIGEQIEAERILQSRSAALPADGSPADVPASSSLAAVELAGLPTNSPDVSSYSASAKGDAVPSEVVVSASPPSSQSPPTVTEAASVVGDAEDGTANAVLRSFQRRL